MLNSVKKLVKWSSTKSSEGKKNQSSLLLAAAIGLLEDVIFWKKIWLSATCIVSVNIVFLIFAHYEINLFQFVFGLFAALLCADAFEAWLKFKHRTTCLKQLSNNGGNELYSASQKLRVWMLLKWREFIFLRDNNHAKAFLLTNILFIKIFLIGRYINGYFLMYLICMFICVMHKAAPYMKKAFKIIELNVESDAELEGLLPDASEVDIKLLSIEPENVVKDEGQSLDFWKPENLPLEDASDSSDNSTTLITNFAVDKMQRDVETSDSDSEDEYIPLEEQQKEHFQTTMEVIQPASSWGSSAYNAIYNLPGAVANMVYSKTDDSKRKRVPSVDSSDGFEIIDKSDLT